MLACADPKSASSPQRTLVTTKRACLEFVDDRGHRSAAQISFFAILSFIPLVLLLAAAFGLVFDDAAIRERIIQTVFDNVPLASGGDRPKLERSVGDALQQAGHLGIFTTVLLLVAASGVMGALRHSINEAWDIDERPPLLQRKALDFALILCGTSILALSVSLTADEPARRHPRRRGRRRLAARRADRRGRQRAAVRLRRARAAVPLPRAADAPRAAARHLAGRARRRRSA